MWIGFCAVPLLASILATCAPEPPLAVGYVEGDYLLIAPVETARISKMLVQRGDRVTEGMSIVELERQDAEIAVAKAKAELARAKSELADLRQGKRKEEIRVAEASLLSARAELTEADRELERDRDLFERGVLPRAQLDLTATKREIAAARVSELEASLAAMQLPARPDRIEAAEAAVALTEASLADANWRLENRLLTAPEDGEIADIIRFSGELAGPQSPVVSILPSDGIKLRLYVPQNSLSHLALGKRLRVRCDGCDASMSATISYISYEPEFTPPVIYSVESRQKLVYLIEATPDAAAAALRPGQIVDVVLDESLQ